MRPILLAVALFSSPAKADPMSKLETEFASNSLIMNGVTTTTDGRRFVVVQPQASGQPRVAEITTGSTSPYPDLAWNSWQDGKNGHTAFVGVNSH